MKKQLNKKTNNIIINKKKDLNKILSEYYIKNYGEIKMINLDFEYGYMGYGEYNGDSFRGYKLRKNEFKKRKELIPNPEFDDMENIINFKIHKKPEYLKHLIADYEFSLPIHQKVLKNISLSVIGYKFLYIFIKDKETVNLPQILFDFVKKYKIYFIFRNGTYLGRITEPSLRYESINTYEYLFCVDVNEANQLKLELEIVLKKNFVTSEISINYLKDSIEFFNRSKYYSKVNLKSLELYSFSHNYDMEFIFFDYREDLLDFFKIGIHLKAMHEAIILNDVYILELDVIINNYNGEREEYEEEKDKKFNSFSGLKCLPYYENIKDGYVFIKKECRYNMLGK
ncbi:MAG: hypothetical protein ACK4IX_01175 [Candidatus Sericytochromatia bacterium]